MRMQRWFPQAVVFASTLTGMPGISLAQSDFPSKPVTLVVPYAAGGATDVVSRLIAQKLTESFKQQVLVENRPGASSTIGTNFVSKAAPDGYTVVMVTNQGIAPGPLMLANSPYNPIKDFTHLVLVGTAANGLAVRTDHPARDLRQFIAMAKARPGAMSYGTSGVGSAGFLTAELLKINAKIDIVHIAYTKGNAPMNTDLMGGHIDAEFDGMASVSTHVRSGRLRLLAVTGLKRSPLFPDVPTIEEVVPGTAGDPWWGISAPAGVPRAVAEKWQIEVIKVLALPDVQARLRDLGFTVAADAQGDYLAHIERQNALFGPIIKSLNIRVE